ncbi:MAG: LamG-like jellyroll fold domain-containing protein [Verrucomicrobiia bacterium]
MRTIPLYWIIVPALALTLVSPAQAVERRQLTGHVPAAVAKLNLQPIGRLPATTRLNLAIGLPLRNQGALGTLLNQIYDPASPSYHRYLTPELFAERYGPTEKDYQTVISFARANGLTVTGTHANRTLLDVVGSVADIERTFHVTMLVYRHPTEARTFYAPDIEPSLDLAVPLLAINGLNNYALPRPLYRQRLGPQIILNPPPAGSGPDGNYWGKDFRNAYAPGAPQTGSGQSVALFECDGYFPSDIAEYVSQARLPSVTLTNVLIDGYNGIPTVGDGGNVEVALDIEMAISMAPGLSKILVYEGPTDDAAVEVDILNRIATDNLAKQISSSWVLFPSQQNDQIYQQFGAQGQSFFQACGDEDAYYPGIFQYQDSAYVTLVGGTTLTMTSTGVAWSAETVWNWGGGTGTGGGISTNVPIPVWQQGLSMTANHGSTTWRNIPDVALTADGVYVIADDGFAYDDVGGTSCAAPLWAAFTALVNQQAAAAGLPPVGFLNPTAYTIGQSANYSNCFHDITTGNNESPESPANFSAVSGYDLCTGWGTPAGTNLINAILSVNVYPLLTIVGTTVTGGNGNGAIDPDECDFLYVSIQNYGNGTATVVNATLSTTTPGVTILQPASTYPDLVPTATASNTIPFQISTSPSFVCDAPIALSLAVTFNDGLITLTYTNSTSNVYAITQTNGASIVPGVTDTGNHCDDCCTTIGLPFAYPLYGLTYTNVTLSSNGNLQFTGSNDTPKNVCVPAYGFDQSIFPLWQDLRTDGTVNGASNGVFTSTSGVTPNRIFNIEFRAVYYGGGVSTSTVNFEVRLYENQQRFDIIYGNLNGNGDIATVGVQNDTNNFTQFECSSGVLADGLQLTFQVPPCPDGGGQCQTGLLGYWTFDEGSGSTAYDSSGNTNTGTIVDTGGNPISWTGGVFNGALSFDGQTQVIVSNSPSLNPFSGITISAWVDADDWGSAGYAPRLLEKGDSDNQYALLSTSFGQLEFLLPGVSNGVLVANAPSLGSWHHVAGTFNGSSMVLYIDGQIAAQQPASGVLSITSDGLAIGNNPSGSVSNGFSGAMDDVRIYGAALSPAEIAQLYNTDTVGDGIPNWWRQQYFGTGSSTNSNSCATCDFDGTGQNNLFKYLAGLDPTDPSSAFGLNISMVSTSYDVSSGLVASYPFNGNLTNDASGNGHNGIAVGGVSLTTDRFGNPNSALQDDGSTGYIRVPTELTTGNPFTWSVWFQPGFTDTNVTYNLLNQGGAPGQGQTSPSIWINYIGGAAVYPGSIDFYYYDGGSGVHMVSPAVAQWDTNAWYHVAVTSDGSGDRCLYVNGVCVNSDSGQSFGQSQLDFYIGATAAYNKNYFLGDIDDVLVYNRALSEQEIQQLYAGASITQPSVQFNPVLKGRTYTPQFSTDLVSGVWLPLTTFTGPLTNGNLVTITDTNPIPPQEFYRIGISKP